MTEDMPLALVEGELERIRSEIKKLEVQKGALERLLDLATRNREAVMTNPPDTARLRELAWRDGFECARECLTEDEAFSLTCDVEEDAWADSKTRAALLDAADELSRLPHSPEKQND